MGLRERLPFLNSNRVNQPQATNNYDDSIAAALQGRPGVSRVTSNGRDLSIQYSAEQIETIYQGYIFGAIRKISNRVADVLTERLETYRLDGNEWVEDKTRHPYLDAIDAAEMDNSMFFKGIGAYLVVLGEAFIFTGERKMEFGNVKPVEAFTLLQSNYVTRMYHEDGSGELKAYKEKWKKPGMNMPVQNFYLPDNIISVTDLNPWNLEKGYGMMRPILDKVSLESQATRLQSATMGNTIKAPGIASIKDKDGNPVPVEFFDEFERRINDKFTSNDMDKAGVPILSNGGSVEWENIDQDWEKLAMKGIREMNRDAFFAALGVSKTILGIEQSGTTRETSRVQTEQFILDIVMPIAQGILSAFNQDYINHYPDKYKQRPQRLIATAPIEKDLEQEKAEAEVSKLQAEAFKTYIDAGMEPNQAATLAGLETEKVTMLAPVINKADTQFGHVHDAPFVPEIATNALTQYQQNNLAKARNVLVRKVTDLDTNLCAAYTRDLNAATTEERTVYLDSLTAAMVDYYIVATSYYGDSRYAELAKLYAKDIKPFEISAAVRTDIEHRLAKVSNAHFRTVENQLTEIIHEGLRNDTPRREILKAVQERVKGVTSWQVERLVNTETANAYRQATFYSDQRFITDNGYVGKAYKVWRTNSPNPCPFCASNAGRRVPFAQDFYKVGDMMEAEDDGKQMFMKVGFVDMNVPAAHANCHCDYQLELDE